MAATPKKLAQGAMAAATATLYTCPGGKARAHCSQLWLCNTGASNRTIALYAHGTAATNALFTSLSLAAGETKVIDAKVVLAPTETFSGNQGAGTDVTFTLYGVEEDT